MTSVELNKVFEGSGGSCAPMAWERRADDSASNSRKRRETFQDEFESVWFSMYLSGEAEAISMT